MTNPFIFQVEHRRQRSREGVRGWTEATRRVYRRTTWAGRPYGPPGRNPHCRWVANPPGRLWIPEDPTPGAPRQSALQRLGPVVLGDRPSFSSRPVEAMVNQFTSEAYYSVEPICANKPTHQGAATSRPSAAVSEVKRPSTGSPKPTRHVATQTPASSSEAKRRRLKDQKRKYQRQAKLAKIFEPSEEKIVTEGLKKLSIQAEPVWQVARWRREKVDIPGLLLSFRQPKAEGGSPSTFSTAANPIAPRPQENPAPTTIDPLSVTSPSVRPIVTPWQDEARALPPSTSSTTSTSPSSKPAATTAKVARLPTSGSKSTPTVPSTALATTSAKTTQPAAAQGLAGQRVQTRPVVQAGGFATQVTRPLK